MKMFNARISQLVLFALIVLAGCQGHTEKDLYDKLLQNYTIRERPVKDFFKPVTVEFHVTLVQIINLDEKKQVMTWNGWLQQHWTDVNLKWNYSEYRINSLIFEKGDIWTPDLAVYNNAKSNFQLISDQAEEKIVVDNNGRCLWMTPLVFRTTCKLDITYFPFDEQKCVFEVGSWAYTGDRLNITYKKNLKHLPSNYIVNGVWDVHDISGELKVGYYACCVEPYPSVIYTITLRRRSSFYLLNFFLPSTWIALLAAVSFCLPQASGERMTLLITNLLSLTFFMMILSNIIPATSEVTPLFEAYLTAVFIEICLALVARSFIDKTKRRNTTPGIVTRKIINGYLARWLRIEQSYEYQLRTHDQRVSSSGVELEAINVKFSPGIQSNLIKRSRSIGSRPIPNGSHQHTNCEDRQTNRPSNEVDAKILSSLEIVSDSVKETAESDIKQKELDRFLLHLDELFFWIFTLALLLTLLIFFLTPPHISLT